jgi:hypothetical protein
MCSERAAIHGPNESFTESAAVPRAQAPGTGHRADLNSPVDFWSARSSADGRGRSESRPIGTHDQAAASGAGKRGEGSDHGGVDNVLGKVRGKQESTGCPEGTQW